MRGAIRFLRKVIMQAMTCCLACAAGTVVGLGHARSADQQPVNAAGPAAAGPRAGPPGRHQLSAGQRDDPPNPRQEHSRQADLSGPRRNPAARTPAPLN